VRRRRWARGMKVIGVYNIKGGVGKTAAAVNLGYLAAAEGLRTLIWDLDPQAAATFYLRVQPKVRKARKVLAGRLDAANAIKGSDFERLDLLPADFAYRNMDILFGGARKPRQQLRRMLRPFAADYDMVILDCAPSVSLVSENVFLATRMLLVPVIPTVLSLRTLSQLLDFFEHEKLSQKRIHPFFSMAERRKRLHRETMASPPESRVDFLNSFIPFLADVERMGVERAPVASFAPRSAAAAAYRRLWTEIRDAVPD
ncbi:MAG: AAA family ATPase, partial [Pseudomonadota bacterium]